MESEDFFDNWDRLTYIMLYVCLGAALTYFVMFAYHEYMDRYQTDQLQLYLNDISSEA